MSVIDVKPGRTIAAAIPEDLRRDLPMALGRDDEAGVGVIGQPHTVRLALGDRSIEVHPGGYNSVTYLQMGYRPTSGTIEDVDYSRIGGVSTDTGSRLLTGGAVRRLAAEFCAMAESGLGAKAMTDPIDIMAGGAARELLAGKGGAVDICIVEGAEQTFVLRLSAGDPSNQVAGESDARFRLLISLSQTLS